MEDRPADETRMDEFTSHLKKIAEALRKRRPGRYWKSFPVSALMGWLRHEGRCVYCKRLLVDEECIVGAIGAVDHLLPSKRYPELNFKDAAVGTDDAILHFNCVPACFTCNGLKRQYDPNEDGKLLYLGLESFSSPKKAERIQNQLIERAEKKINELKQALRPEAEADLEGWNEALRKLRGDAR